MGKRFLMIEHRGRKSGKLYRTVVEVAGRHPDNNEWIVTAGFGPKSDWYRNLVAGTPEAVWIGSRRHSASLRFLESSEASEDDKDIAFQCLDAHRLAIVILQVLHLGTGSGDWRTAPA